MPVSHSVTDARFVASARLLATGELSAALAELKAVYAQAEAAGDADLMAACLCQIAWGRQRLGDAQAGLEYAVASRMMWRRLGNGREKIRALAVEALLYLDLGLSDDAFAAAERAFALVEVIDDPAMKSFVSAIRGIVLTVTREPQLGLACLQEAAAIAEALDAPFALGFYRVNVGFAFAKQAATALMLGDEQRAQNDHRQAIDETERGHEIARACGDRWTQRVALCNLAEYYANAGDLSKARACLAQWSAVSGDPGTSLHIHHLYTLGIVEHADGALETARERCVEALEFATANGLIDHQVNAAEQLCKILEEMGDVSAALAMHRRFHALYVQQSGELTRRRARAAQVIADPELPQIQLEGVVNPTPSDSLTGISSRLSFEQILDRLGGVPLSIARVDLDQLKQINDRHTHVVGDAVLRRVAQLMIAQLGSHGHAARWGGDEFAVVLPYVPTTAASALCEGLRVAIACADWSDLGLSRAVTVSIGLATDDGSLSVSTLLQQAEERLYCAKTAGRNRVVDADVALLSRPDAPKLGKKKSKLP